MSATVEHAFECLCLQICFNSRSPNTILKGRDKFRVESFFPVVDSLISNLKVRSQAYGNVFENFGFLENLIILDEKDISKSCENITSIYKNDLNHSEFVAECIHLKAYIVEELRKVNSSGLVIIQKKYSDDEGDESQQEDEEDPSEYIEVDKEANNNSEENELENKSNKKVDLKRLYTYLWEENLIQAFPNLDIVLRTYLCLMISNASGERSFSKLKLIKSNLRSVMSENRLNYLSILSIENEFLKTLDFTDVVDTFAEAKARKRPI